MNWFRGLTATPGRQAAAWAALGILGIGLAAVGLVLVLTDDRGSRPGTAVGREPVTPRPTATATASPSPSPSPRPSATAAATSSPTPRSATPTATPTRTAATATPAPIPETDPPGDPVPPALPTATPTSTSTSTPTPSPTPSPTATATATATPVPRVYCQGSAGVPPVLLAGLIEIGGAPAPAGTVVFVVFDGIPGPAATVTTADVTGYSARFVIDASPGCANAPGAGIGLLVNGVFVNTGYIVPTGAGSPLLLFDVSLP